MSNKEKEVQAPDDVQTDMPVEEAAELTLEEKYSQALAAVEELRKDNLRVLADGENFKKRLLREKEEFFKFATSAILEETIPVIDNLDLALAHGRQTEACKDLVTGVEMTMNIFLDTMKKHGLEQIAAVDVPFDPALHEALSQIERDDLEENTVCQMLQKGYMLKDRLLRPAKVMVSRKAGA
ncbi:MAG: nucleotide exchange factor GrpE [Desulfomicrobium sp.]|nr:nucleotide exchange factor GrpE [Pseudomonadota bacterium]MBV1712164.1 nucleotide exchange factor GrpE [Desulfomicrobium sp.]MBU4572802.1 nucleotide exchange factor GrpE [Pseudomonadota bacterium]MBU4594797.1 nucleotide exchange factor GrpE [Pseudomonadota bacterium]MBV1718564.1 nucleotide exchange factor GrpE [Desulfomicrobium sp.]